MVACYHKLIDNEFKEMNKPFVEKEFDWDKMKGNCKTFFIIASDNDPYIPLEINKEMAGILGAELKIVHHGRHLNKKTGFEKFSLLSNLILNFAA